MVEARVPARRICLLIQFDGTRERAPLLLSNSSRRRCPIFGEPLEIRLIRPESLKGAVQVFMLLS